MFSNINIQGPNKSKPHLCIVDGYWRVSPMMVRRREHQHKIWHAAHLWAMERNNERLHTASKLVNKVANL